MKQVRIKDIAREAGVSIGTVDRVLHNRGEVAESTRKKVLHIAREMQYRPNIVAQALKAKKTHRLAVLLPNGSGDNVFWLLHPQGIEKAVKELQPFLIDVRYFLYELTRENEFPVRTQEIIRFHPDGVILAPVFKKESRKFCRELDSRGIPYVFIDTYIDETRCLAFIGEDAYQAGRVAAGLIDYGLIPSRDILIVNIARNLEDTENLNLRNRGFLHYFADTGTSPRSIYTLEIASTGLPEVEKSMDSALATHPHIGAILVSGAKTHVIARYLEIKERRDMILVGYEVTGKNLSFLKKGIIRFLIGQKPVEQAARAVKILFDYLTMHQIPARQEYQPVEIIHKENAGNLNSEK